MPRSEARSASVAFRWSVFPIVIGASVAAAIALIQRGVAAPLAILGPQIGSFLVVAVLERVYPLHTDWNRSRGDIRVDAGHTLTVAAAIGIATPLAVVVGVAIAGWLSANFGLGLWPDHWPIVCQLVLAMIVAELPQYWVHRLEHEHDWLWRFHAVHHSAPRLYWLNAGRFHPIDIAINFLSFYSLLVALGCGVEVLALYGLVAAVHGIFQHANLQMRLGWLNWFFSMAELHRWHHSRLVRESNTNYGQTLIIWDVVFRTRFLPKERKPPEDIGMTGLDAFPMTYLAQLASPFRWAKIKCESTAPGSARAAA